MNTMILVLCKFIFGYQHLCDLTTDILLKSFVISPIGFDLDTVNNPDGIDRTIFEKVPSDFGDPALASDWTTLCDLGSITPADIEFVGIFVDISESMPASSIQASLEKFREDMESKGIAIRNAEDESENWIRPFLGTLAPTTKSEFDTWVSSKSNFELSKSFPE